MAMLRPSASLYVGGLSPDVTEANLFEIFNQVGPVASIRVCRDAVTRRSLSYAYVNFHNLSDAERALDTLNYTSIKGRACRIMWSQRDPALRKSGQGNIFIKNLEKSIDNKTLHDTFSAFGNIMSCKVMVDENANSRGFGFVHFENPESADLAINQVNGMLLNEKKVYVGHHISRKERHSKYEEMKKNFTNVFVKNLDDAVDTDDKLNAAFTPYGKIISAVVMRDENNKSRGFGFVNFSTHEEAVAACDDMNEKEVNGKKLYVGRAQKKAERKEELLRKYEALRQERLSKYQGVNLFIKNLDDAIDDERLRNEFSAFGTITSAKVQADDKGLSRGFGFVCYSSPEEATKAVTEMNGRMLGTKPIYVALAQRREVRRQQLEAQYAARAQMKFAQQSGLLGPAMYGQPIFYSPMGVPPHARGQQGYVFPPPQMMANPRPRYGSSQPGGPQPQQPELMGGYLPGPNVGRTPRAPGPRNSSRPNQPPASGRVPNGVQPGQPPLANQPPRKSGNTGFRLTSTARNSRVEQPMPQQNLAPLPSGPVDLSSHLATLSTEEQKQMLGERLFGYIFVSQPELAGKITGMLLEMDNAEILHLLDSPKALDEKVNEAIAVLQGSA